MEVVVAFCPVSVAGRPGRAAVEGVEAEVVVAEELGVPEQQEEQRGQQGAQQ